MYLEEEVKPQEKGVGGWAELVVARLHSKHGLTLVLASQKVLCRQVRRPRQDES